MQVACAQVRESIADLSEPAVVDKTWRNWWQNKSHILFSQDFFSGTSEKALKGEGVTETQSSNDRMIFRIFCISSRRLHESW